MHGYSPFRIVPILVVVAFILYMLSMRDRQKQLFVLAGLIIVILISVVVFLPLFRYSVEHPDLFYYRALTRVGSLERPLPGSPVNIFFGQSLECDDHVRIQQRRYLAAFHSIATSAGCSQRSLILPGIVHPHVAVYPQTLLAGSITRTFHPNPHAAIDSVIGISE